MKFGNVFAEFCGHIPVFVKIALQQTWVPADLHTLPMESCALDKYLSEKKC